MLFININEIKIGKFGLFERKIVGFQTRVNGVHKRYRLCWDRDLGAHINIEIGKGAARRNYHLNWEGTEEEVLSLIEVLAK